MEENIIGIHTSRQNSVRISGVFLSCFLSGVVFSYLAEEYFCVLVILHKYVLPAIGLWNQKQLAMRVWCLLSFLYDKTTFSDQGKKQVKIFPKVVDFSLTICMIHF